MQVREVSPAEAEKDAGNAAFKAGDWAKAIECYGRALAHDPQLLPALNNRAMAHLKAGQHAQAEEDCVKVGRMSYVCGQRCRLGLSHT